MTEQQERIDLYKEKYGAAAIENGLRLRSDFLELVDWRDEMDQNYARLWLDFTFGGLFERGVLDDRTRLLVAVSQWVALDEPEELEQHLRAALDHGASPREALEVILQATVYVGYPRVNRAARIFRRVAAELGRLEEITQTQLPLDGRNAERSLDEERPRWAPGAEEMPRREELIEKYGWLGISTRLLVQAHQGNDPIIRFDRYDPHYLQLWLDFIYAGMYARNILDNRTRLLCMVGICVVLNETTQLQNHLRGALIHGATPREVLEVLLHSTAYVGMPGTLGTAALFERILEEQGRTSELEEASYRPPSSSKTREPGC